MPASFRARLHLMVKVSTTACWNASDWILGRMYKLGKIDQAAYESAVAEPLNASYHVPSDRR